MSVYSEHLRLPLIYTAIMVLAAFLGSVLAAGAQMDAVLVVVALAAVMVSPFFLKWHRAMLFLSWNSTLGFYFLVGQSPLWISLAVVSLGLSLAERAILREQRFISNLAITRPLVVFVVVVVVTMLATGGLGIQWLGGLGIQWLGNSGLSGGRKYLWVLGACLGYFALTAQAVPAEKAPLKYGLFFLGGLTGFVGPAAGWLGGPLSYLQYVFDPVEGVLLSGGGFRIKGMASTGVAIVAWLLARHGFGGVFHGGRFWRIGILGLGMLLALLSGFRTTLVTIVFTLVVLFFLEGHHRTPRLLLWLGGGLLGLALLVPLTPHLPTPVQRSLAFLPLPVDPMVRFDAESTVQWREGLWGALVQDVPRYFWLGKGLTISTVDMEWSETIARFDTDLWYRSYLTGEHHNGFLSLIISFGIWGLLVFFWLLGAGLWVLARNYRDGITELRTVNAYLLASFIVWNILFFSYAGTLYWSMKDVTGMLGLSVALNGGIALPPEVADADSNSDSAGGRPRLDDSSHDA